MEELRTLVEKTTPATRLSDPYKCTLNLRPREGEAKGLRRIFHPLLKWIDPVFQFVTISENRSRLNGQICTSSCTPQGKANRADESIDTPALSLMLFLLEEQQGENSAQSAMNCLAKPPFRFHHKIELSSRNCRGQRSTAARQDFYIASPEYPLVSVCPVHYGKEHLRFSIFVTNFSLMVEFYRCVLGKPITSKKPGFCLFNIYSQPGIDIQLALKYSAKLKPRPVKSACLHFKIRNICELESVLCCDVRKINGEDAFMTCDPEGNIIILEETEPIKENENSVVDIDDMDLDDVCSMFSVDFADDAKSEVSFSDSYDSGAYSFEADVYTPDSMNLLSNSSDSAVYDSSIEEMQLDELFKTGKQCQKTTESEDFQLAATLV